MPRQKNETLTIRTTTGIKDWLRQAAEREHRSLASMIAVLVKDYARKMKLQPSATAQSSGENQAMRLLKNAGADRALIVLSICLTPSCRQALNAML